MKTNSLVLSTLLALVAVPAAHAQQGVSLAVGYTDFTAWNLFGNASAANQTPGNGFTYSALQLTANGGGQAGAGFAPTTLAMDFDSAFFFDFNFYIPVSTDLRGDGMTFVLAATPGVGGGGSDLGYGGLGGASVAFAIDTFHFDGEAVSPSLQILQGGNMTPLASTETGLGDTIRDPDFQWYGSVAYTPSGDNDQLGILTGRIQHINLGSFEVSANVDFAAIGLAGASSVHYGFSAGSGLATDAHIVTSAVPVPEPGSWALMLAGLGVVGWLGRRR